MASITSRPAAAKIIRSKSRAEQSPYMVQSHDRFRQLWGPKAKLTKLQCDPLASIYAGKDVLVVAPTGSGKSAVFQLPPVVTSQTTLVVSPLIALMRDQVKNAVARGIPATQLDSSLSAQETVERCAEVKSGKYRLVFVSPEKLSTTKFREFAAIADFAFVAVDEAHCASVNSFNFRPDYMRIANFVEALPSRPQVMAFTATATSQVANDIVEYCGLANDHDRYIASPVRKNITYRTDVGGSMWGKLESVSMLWAHNIKAGKPGKYVVYVRSRSAAEKIAKIIASTLEDKGVPDARTRVLAYHAGMQHSDLGFEDDHGRQREIFGRSSIQQRFADGRCNVLVATSAFGMGVDIPDIRSVVHFGMPLTLEDYVQESGRAARDGGEGHAALFSNDDDYSYARKWVDDQYPSSALFAEFWQHLVRTYGMSDSMIAVPEALLANYNRDSKAKLQLNVRQISTIITALSGYQFLSVIPSQDAVMVTVSSVKRMDAAISERTLDGSTLSAAMFIVRHVKAANKGTNTVTLSRRNLIEASRSTDIDRTLRILHRRKLIEYQNGYGDPYMRCRKTDPLTDTYLDRFDEARLAARVRFNAIASYSQTGDTAIFSSYFLSPNV